MKILALRGKNLASLAGEFEVDFEQEPLKSAGLFAISGATGAGKSTLLDALCMALYESTPRLIKAGGNKTLPDGKELISQQDAGNLLRRGAGEGYAEVDFVGCDQRQYRARWSVRRSRNKAAGSLQPTTMTLHELPDMLPIGGKKTEVKAEIEQRIGLKFEQFTRAVLLAQNEFSSFLKAEDNERGELLETLTGSAIYTQLSKRAYDRAKLETQELQRLNDRLADQKPLSDQEHQQLQQDEQAAQTQVQILETRKVALENALRWFDREQQLQIDVAQAEQQVQQTQAEQTQAAPRLAYLQRVEAVQSARPLVMEVDRLTGSVTQLQQRIRDTQGQRDITQQVCQEQEQRLISSKQQRELADQALVKAEPQLDRAKALVASIQAIQPAHQAAQQAHSTAQFNTTQAQHLQQQKQADLNTTQERLHDADTWLKQHSGLQVLAENWSAWDILLRQAKQNDDELTHHTSVQAQHAQDQQAQTEQVTPRQHQVAQSQTQLDSAEQNRSTANQSYIEANTKFSEQAERKQHLDTRREQLSNLEQIALSISEQNARLQKTQQQAQTTQQDITQSSSAAEQAQAQLPALIAAQEQAERSLKIAETACFENVENLRNALEADQACPVCGSHEHPYRNEHPQLHAMLAQMQEQVQSCRLSTQAKQQEFHTLAVQAQSLQTQLVQIQQEQAQTQAQANSLQQTWQTHALFKEVEAKQSQDNTASLADWIAQQREQVQQELSNIKALEDAYRSALQCKEQAQIAFESATQQHNANKEAASKAAYALAQITSKLAQIQTQIEQSNHRLSACLQELAPALDPIISQEELGATTQWQSDWKNAPEHFAQQCAEHARSYLRQSRERETYVQRLATYSLELTNLKDTHSKAEQEQTRTHHNLSASLQALQSKQAELDAVLTSLALNQAPDTNPSKQSAAYQERTLSQIETQLKQAISTAKLATEQAAQSANAAAQAHSRSTEALAQATQHLQTEQTAHEAADAQLQACLQQHIALLNIDEANEEASEDAGVHTLDKIDAAASTLITCLRDLLQQSSDWQSQQRTALQALANQSQQAQTLHQERQRLCTAHQTQRPDLGNVLSSEDINLSADPSINISENTGDNDDHQHSNVHEDDKSIPQQQIKAALQALAIKRQTANDHNSHLQSALAQDQARRTQAAGILQHLQNQEAKSKLWETMNQLIGAADGKKFRNYAQQYTLDVLLGYANRHLHELARRYRLQRINDTLALMVIDQDMGDEARSVHSLSGGESFLVSLALALGLASLSSNRVRVESLFIDEGFGSLDAETLRVAMDALDGLQAMGRKVGVISHVQEMTERIAVKVMVVRGAGGGSLVGVA